MKRLFWITTLILVLSALGSAAVFAQGSTPTDDEVNAIARDLFCPVCENTPLDVCPTEACKEWREEIRDMLADGKSEEEIKQHFVDYYGARVLSEPPRSGFNWLVYVVPPIAIVAGLFVLFRAFSAWSQSADEDSETEASFEEDTPSGGDTGMDESDALSAPDAEYISRMEEELRKRK
jgi:cytochrome c-type biogenesis protein CcmH